MKIIHEIIIILIFSVITGGGKSQNLYQLISDPSKTFFEVQTTLHNNPNTLKDASEPDLKRYTRWLAFWSSRIDQTGSIGNSLSYFQQFANSNPDLFTGQTTK